MDLVALILIAAGLAAISADLHFTQFGVLAAAGLIAAATGLVLLLAGVWPLWGAVLFGAAVVAAAGAVGLRTLGSIRQVARAMPADLVSGRLGTVRSTLAPAGLVIVDGILWRAVSPAGAVKEGDAVRILSRRGLTLTVAPLGPGESGGAAVFG